MSSFSLVFPYQCSLFRNLCIFWSKPHNIHDEISCFDQKIIPRWIFCWHQTKFVSTKKSAPWMARWLAVDKSRKNCIEMMMKEISPWLFPLHNSHPGLWIYYIYICFFNRGQSNHNLFLWYLWTPCIPCTPCTNDLNLLQKPVSLVSDVALVMVTRPFAGDHRSSPVQADI